MKNIILEILASVFVLMGIWSNTTIINDFIDKNTPMYVRCFIIFIGTVGYINLLFWIGIIMVVLAGGITVR